MSATVQGFLAKITIDGQDISAAVENFNIDRTKNTNPKSTMDGSPFSKSIPGSETGTLSCDGLIDQANQTLLEAIWLKETEVPFVIENDEGATTDMVWTGSVVLGDLTVATQSTDVWRFTLSGITSGQTVVTPYTV